MISLLITLFLLCTCCMAEEAPAAAADSPVPPSMWKEGDAHRIEQKNLPLHVGAVENLVPWAFKEDGTVKLLGSVTGGGSCGMLPMTTAWGTSYVISGPDRISFLKNGAYYDVDRGAEPDYVISSYDRYYDREALAEFIRNLY